MGGVEVWKCPERWVLRAGGGWFWNVGLFYDPSDAVAFFISVIGRGVWNVDGYGATGESLVENDRHTVGDGYAAHADDRNQIA